MRDRDEAEDIHLELPPPFRDRQGFNRTRHRDSGIVHQTAQALFADHGFNRMDRRRDRCGVSHVEPDRHQTWASRRSQHRPVRLIAYPGKDPMPQFVQCQRAGCADSGRSAGDDHRGGFGIWSTKRKHLHTSWCAAVRRFLIPFVASMSDRRPSVRRSNDRLDSCAASSNCVQPLRGSSPNRQIMQSFLIRSKDNIAAVLEQEGCEPTAG